MENRRVAELEQELTTLAGHLNAGNYRWLMLLAEFDALRGYVGVGVASCAHWVSWRCGVGLQAVREKVRVAPALQNLPRVSDAMRRGMISYCMVRAITRVGTPDNEEGLLRIAEAGTVSHVEKLVRLMRREQRAEELEQGNARHASRYLQAYTDDDGCVVVKGVLSPEQGALFMKALRGACDALREAEGDSRESFGAPDSADDRHGARNADALECLAERFLAHGHAPLAARERHVVHVILLCRPPVSARVRLSGCDARGGAAVSAAERSGGQHAAARGGGCRAGMATVDGGASGAGDRCVHRGFALGWRKHGLPVGVARVDGAARAADHSGLLSALGS